MPRKSSKKESSEKTKDPKQTEAPKAVEAPPVEAPPIETPPAPEPTERLEGERRTVPPNHIFIGKKPVMGYALSTVMQLTQYDTVILHARGRAISTAVDVAQVAINRLGNGQFETRSITIGTEKLGEGAELRNVSTIEIILGKK
ncbi:MAG: DNA-binding protein Alba [Nitrososphaerota archaeon]|nr:DNA-binding protein Alba [Nitrososphaerota archaeon]MDG6939938.1 DNA-binding protein Alba [Nitrososphaerota archaeon]